MVGTCTGIAEAEPLPPLKTGYQNTTLQNLKERQMINSRDKGHQFERDICQLLRLCGYEAVTSRSESKAMDDLGVDIISDFPFHIQAKATNGSGNISFDSQPYC